MYTHTHASHLTLHTCTTQCRVLADTWASVVASELLPAPVAALSAVITTPVTIPHFPVSNVVLAASGARAMGMTVIGNSLRAFGLTDNNDQIATLGLWFMLTYVGAVWTRVRSMTWGSVAFVVTMAWTLWAMVTMPLEQPDGPAQAYLDSLRDVAVSLWSGAQAAFLSFEPCTFSLLTLAKAAVVCTCVALASSAPPRRVVGTLTAWVGASLVLSSVPWLSADPSLRPLFSSAWAPCDERTGELLCLFVAAGAWSMMGRAYDRGFAPM